jgi:flavin-dependent dehydrogenase
MTKDNPIKIIVVGAGIGGIACAVECKKKGFAVSMYDQVKVCPPHPPSGSQLGLSSIWRYSRIVRPCGREMRLTGDFQMQDSYYTAGAKNSINDYVPIVGIH